VRAEIAASLDSVAVLACRHGVSCRIPDDCIDERRYPLFMGRAVMQELIKGLKAKAKAKARAQSKSQTAKGSSS